MLESPVIQKLEEHTMKKSIIARVGIMAVALTVATTSLMSGTLAKYTTEQTGTATALVAHWEAAFKDGVATNANKLEANFTINMGDNKFLNNTDSSYKNAVDYTGTGTAEDPKIYKFAPGIKGEVPIVVDMKGSEVDTKYTISVKVDSADSDALPDNLVIYDADKGRGTNDANALTLGQLLAGKELSSGIIPSKAKANSTQAVHAADKNQYAQVKLAWDWDYEDATDTDYDANDTAYITDDSMNGGVTQKPIKLKITIVATQSDGTTAWTPKTT